MTATNKFIRIIDDMNLGVEPDLPPLETLKQQKAALKKSYGWKWYYVRFLRWLLRWF